MKRSYLSIIGIILAVSLLFPTTARAQDGINPDGSSDPAVLDAGVPTQDANTAGQDTAQLDAAAVTPPALWSSRIAYTNPGTTPTDLSVTFIDTAGSQTVAPLIPQVPAHGSGVVLVGTIGTQRGSAMLSASQPILAVYEQYASGSSTKYGSPLYSSFAAPQAGGTIYFPYFVYQFNEMAGTLALVLSSKVAVQNITDNPVSVTVTLATGQQLTQQIPAKASYHFSGADFGLAAGYRGPLVVSGPDGSIVAASVVEEQGGRRAFAYEGQISSQAAQSFNLPRMYCSTSASSSTSVFFVMNTSPNTDTTLNATFYYGSTGKVITPRDATHFSNLPLAAGQMLPINPCVDANLSAKSGSVKIESTVPNAPIVVVALVKHRYGLGSAFIGQATPAPATSYTYNAPYVTYSSSAYYSRTTLYMLNLGSAKATVKLYYYLRNGTLKRTSTITISPNIIAAQTPSSAGALSSSKFDGSVLIVSTQPLSVVARLSRSVSGVSGITSFGEEYDPVLLTTP